MNYTRGSARKVLSANAPQSLRDLLDSDELSQLNVPGQGITGTGAVIIDNRRRRPLYFDGRFLAARDLTREQNYFLSRQADLGRAGGSGVVHGLQVSPGVNSTMLRISAGHGITPSGELILLESDIEIDLANIADIQRLDAAFGLVQIPKPSLRNHSGLFVLALRPVEFTANPIASYPTTINGPRSAEDGDIVEAAAITLIPYPEDSTRVEINQRRGYVAHQVFVTGGVRGMPAEALPLALIALERGFVEWVDPYLVRREIGSEHSDVLGLGYSPRATREAYLLQYDHNLQDVLRQRLAARRGWKFSATEHFQSLPPVGRMPSAAINPDDFTQIFFPAEVNVELSFVPDDEVRVLLEESLLLPPIDLTLSGDDLESTSVVVLLPVPRYQMRELKSQLSSLSRPLLPAAPNLVSKRRPIEMLRTLRLSINPQVLAVPPGDFGDAAWKKALAGVDMVWFMRRRNLSYKSEITGQPVAVLREEMTAEKTLEARLRALGALSRFRDLRAAASANAVGLISGLLVSPKLLQSDALTEVALSKLEAAPQLDSTAVLGISTAFAQPNFGAGITRAEGINPGLKDKVTVRALLNSNVLSTLDKIGLAVQDPDRLKMITGEVINLANSSDPVKAVRVQALDSATTLLNSRTALASPGVTELALTSMENVTSLDDAQATEITTTFANPTFGSGLARLSQVDAGLKDSQVVKDLATTGALTSLERLGSSVTDETQLKTITTDLLNLARSSDPQKTQKISDMLNNRLKDI